MRRGIPLAVLVALASATTASFAISARSGIEHPPAAARHQLGAHRPGVDRHAPRRRRRQRGVRREARRGKLRVQRLQQLVHDRRLAHDDHERRREHPDRVRGRGRQGGAEVPRRARRASRRWRITGRTLTLSTSTGRRLLVYRASVGAEALRGEWEVTELVHRRRDLLAGRRAATLTLEFAGDQVVGQQRLQHLHRAVRGDAAPTASPSARSLRRSGRAPTRQSTPRSSSTSPRWNWRRPTR